MKISSLKTKIKNILPSRKFTFILGIVLFFGVAIFGLFFVFGGSEKFASKGSQKDLEGKTVVDLLQKDSDGDSIYDWEETLWGTDKNDRTTFENTPDSVYIENQRKSLDIEGEVGQNSANETDKFAREFFSSYVALQTEGVDPATINNFSSAVGQKLADPKLTDKFTIDDVKTSTKDTPEDWVAYYLKVKAAFDSYKESGIGNELDIVSSGLVTYNSQGSAQMEELILISDAYVSFATDIMAFEVPESMAEYHIAIANAANNTGVSVENMSKVISDPIVGLAGISQYQENSETLVAAVTSLETTLSE